ncbi:unnamed protein product [Leptosia nina]|uniref:Ig-like domain-containing protein n=1 Tax=Leptosia nina TaxID=320188 RepID=A0AAV1IZP2_9NEOP
MTVYYLIILCFIPNVLSQNSFTLVLDTTQSMSDEMYIIKSNINTVLNGAKFSEIILLQFNEPDVGPPLIFTNNEDFLDHLDLVEVGGGQGCPEKSLSAIQMALERSQPSSYIYLFTDANAQLQERRKLEAIAKLCRDKKSKVFVLQSGSCQAEESNDIYYDVAKVCSGSVYHFELATLRKAFPFIKETMSFQWTTLNVREVLSNYVYGVKQYTFSIDAYTSTVLIGISGENPEAHIINSLGEVPSHEYILHTKHALVFRIHEPTMGDYLLDVNCQGPSFLSVLTQRQLKFKYGFSPKLPRSLKETSDRPLPGTSSNILIELPETQLELTSVQVIKFKTEETTILAVEKMKGTEGIFKTHHLFEPGKSFKLMITARDKVSYEMIYGTSKVIETQHQGMVTEWMRPIVYIIDGEVSLLDFGVSTTLACKIDSFPEAKVWWEDEDSEKIPSETSLLEIPSTYISYVNIGNATKNGTVTCKAKNAVGESESTMELFVNRTFVFEVIQNPSDITVEYGDESKLYCEVIAYPEATITWYHNGTKIENTERRIEINSDEHSLLIKDMDIEDAGEYECEIENGVQSVNFRASVYITGLDAPAVQLDKSEVVLKPGDWTQQNCTVTRGKPTPTISWRYKKENSYDYVEMPYGVYVEGSVLKIPSAESNQGGVYICEAHNIIGVDRQEILVKVQYPPKIKSPDESLVVKQGDLVTLPCEVDAVPDAQVHWDMYQDDVIIAFDDRHYTDNSHTHRFTAKGSDSGMYHCIAENSMGTATRTVNVNVWVAPYIEQPVAKNVTQKIRSSIVLECYINIGNPMPSTKWEFIAQNTNISVLTRGHATGKLDFTLNNITKKNEGIYRCIAENEVGVDSIQIFVKVV